MNKDDHFITIISKNIVIRLNYYSEQIFSFGIKGSNDINLQLVTDDN